jgi:hypothetical protein
MSSILASEATYIFQKGSSDKFGAVVVESATLPDGDGGGCRAVRFHLPKSGMVLPLCDGGSAIQAATGGNIIHAIVR